MRQHNIMVCVRALCLERYAGLQTQSIIRRCTPTIWAIAKSHYTTEWNKNKNKRQYR